MLTKRSSSTKALISVLIVSLLSKVRPPIVRQYFDAKIDAHNNHLAPTNVCCSLRLYQILFTALISNQILLHTNRRASSCRGSFWLCRFWSHHRPLSWTSRARIWRDVLPHSTLAVNHLQRCHHRDSGMEESLAPFGTCELGRGSFPSSDTESFCFDETRDGGGTGCGPAAGFGEELPESWKMKNVNGIIVKVISKSDWVLPQKKGFNFNSVAFE